MRVHRLSFNHLIKGPLMWDVSSHLFSLTLHSYLHILCIKTSSYILHFMFYLQKMSTNFICWCKNVVLKAVLVFFAKNLRLSIKNCQIVIKVSFLWSECIELITRRRPICRKMKRIFSVLSHIDIDCRIKKNSYTSVCLSEWGQTVS